MGKWVFISPLVGVHLAIIWKAFGKIYKNFKIHIPFDFKIYSRDVSRLT